MNIPTLNEEKLEEYIDNRQVPLVIDLWMDECPPCNMMEPKLKSVAQDYEDKIEVYKVRVTEDSPLMDDYGIEAVPTLLMFKHGSEVNRLEGLVHSQELEEAFQKLIG